jgi:hypothetical protein
MTTLVLMLVFGVPAIIQARDSGLDIGLDDGLPPRLPDYHLYGPNGAVSLGKGDQQMSRLTNSRESA